MTDLNLNLGIDFGTSFTKVCVRDTDRNSSWLVTFSNSRSLLDEALVPTKLAICSDGQLLAGLTQSEWQEQTNTIQVSIDFIKMRLAHIDLSSEGQGYHLDCLQNFQGIDLNADESIENLCAYYLSSIILKAKSWIIRNNADLVKNQIISWSANVGVPVKYSDSKAIARFNKVLHLAWLLSEDHPQSFHELWQQMKQMRNQLSRKDIRCFAVPEIAAAVYSYTISRSAEPGTYIFFDVGSGTIEGASFRFWRENAMPKIDFYSGEVEPLGVNALSKRITNCSKVTENELENGLIHHSKLLLEQIYSLSASIARSLQKGEYVANKTFIAEGHFRVSVEGVKSHLQKAQDIQSQKLLHLILAQHLIHRQVAQTIWACKEKNPDHFKKASSLIVFLGGGGKNSEYYRDTIESTYTAFGHQYAGIPIYELREVPSPSKRGTGVEDFNMSGINHSNFHRFAIAYGLSIPDYEAPEVKLPRQFPDVPPRPHQPIIPESGRYPDDHSSM